MKIIREKIPGKDGYLNIMMNGDYEYVDPYEKIGETFFHLQRNIIMSIADIKADELEELAEGIDTEKLFDKIAVIRAKGEYDRYMSEIKSTKVPKALFDLLTMTKKSNQVRALRGLSLNNTILMALVFEACGNLGYRYSMYTAHHDHAGLDKSKMPRIAHKEDDGTILTIGKSGLTEGQIKAAIEQKKVNVARFLDNGSNWHCFFYTYNSISGKESGGIPHIHYISHLWGMTRAEVVRQLKRRDYKLPDPRPHIPFNRYGNRPYIYPSIKS